MFGWFRALLLGSLLSIVAVDASLAAPANGPLTLDEAVVKVRKESGGRVVSAQESAEEGVVVYRIKVLLPDGRVKVITVDPQTGDEIQ